MKERLFIWAVVCIVMTIVFAWQSIDAQIPGPPAGTEGLLYVVLDFKIPATVGPAVGRNLADDIASQLRKNRRQKVVREPTELSAVELRDPIQTRKLHEKLGADILVGGNLDESGALTVSAVRAKDARALDTENTEIGAIVISITGTVHLLSNGHEVKRVIRFGEVLQAGDSVRCDPDSMIVLLISGKEATIRPSDGWFMVTAPRVNASSGQLPFARMVSVLLKKSTERDSIIAAKALGTFKSYQ